MRTISKPIAYSGFGIFTKKISSIRLEPGPVNTGILFLKNGQKIPARLEYCEVNGQTLQLNFNGSKIIMVEHLLAAIYGLEITNLLIEVSGDEIPFGDGSASVFVRLIKKAGIKTQIRLNRRKLLKRPIFIKEGSGFILALPSSRLSIAGYINFPFPQFFQTVLNPISFTQGLASARTFGSFSDRKFLEKILPFSISEFRIPSRFGGRFHIFPKHLRFPNEPIRHKLLDLLGHLTLLGKRFQGKIFAYRPNHQMYHRFINELKTVGKF